VLVKLVSAIFVPTAQSPLPRYYFFFRRPCLCLRRACVLISFILKQTHFNVNNGMQRHEIQCSATVSKSGQLPEDGQVGPKHAAIGVILM
jgi:hypothetical protein